MVEEKAAYDFSVCLAHCRVSGKVAGQYTLGSLNVRMWRSLHYSVNSSLAALDSFFYFFGEILLFLLPGG